MLQKHRKSNYSLSLTLKTKRMKKRLFMLLLTVACAIAGAQALTVRGTVVDLVNWPR